LPFSLQFSEISVEVAEGLPFGELALSVFLLPALFRIEVAVLLFGRLSGTPPSRFQVTMLIFRKPTITLICFVAISIFVFG
jgi:hypothetical protein